MPVDRFETQPAALPPTDHVARALLKRGARDDALAFLRAAVARDPGERACAALLRAIEARPDASVYGPELAIDIGMIEAYARSGTLLEALAVLRGSGLTSTTRGRRLWMVLDELLAPCEDRRDQELLQVDVELRTGGAAVALTLLEERIQRGARMPVQARRRHELLREVLLEGAESAPQPKSVRPGDLGPLAESLAQHLSRRDLHGALGTVAQHVATQPDDVEAGAVLEALQRLVGAMKQASAEGGAGSSFSTQPMTGHTVALFQLRMGNLEQAERCFRKLLLQEPLDQVARSRLEDVQTVRAMIDGGRGGADDDAAESAPAERVVDPLLQTARAPNLAALLEGDTTNRVVSVAADELPPLDPIASEPTVRRRISAPVESIATVEVSLDAVTKEVDVGKYERAAARVAEAPEEDRTTPSSPQLLQKHRLRVTPSEGWGPVFPPPRADEWEDEQSTAVGNPEQNAELLLVQGYPDRALQMYDALVDAHPKEERYRIRRDEIRSLAAREPDPATSVEVSLPSLPQRGNEWDEDVSTMVRRGGPTSDTERPAAEVAVEDAGDEGPTLINAGKLSVAVPDEDQSKVRVRRIITID